MRIHCKLCVALPLVAAAVLLAAGIDAAYAFGPYDARNADECRTQVNANYDAMEAEMRAHGNYDGIAVVEDHMRGPDLIGCQGLDSIQRNEQLSAASRRLSSAMDSLRGGHVLPHTVIQALRADRTTIMKISARPYREAYLRQYADYQRYLSAMPSAPPAHVAAIARSHANGNAIVIYRCGDTSKDAIYSDQPCTADGPQQSLPARAVARRLAGESCQTLRRHLADSHRAYDAALQALLASAHQAGDGWRTSEQQRIEAVSDLRWYSDRAHLLGCHAR